MPTYYTRSNIYFSAPVVIQMGMTGAQFSNDIAPDALLVKENGMWKYPRMDGTGANKAGAIVIPNDSATRAQGAVRLRSWQAAFGASAGYSLYVAGNPTNVTDSPYPAASAALYDEATVLVASGTATTNLSVSYDHIIIMPGQRFYITTSGATNPSVRLFFEPV